MEDEESPRLVRIDGVPKIQTNRITIYRDAGELVDVRLNYFYPSNDLLDKEGMLWANELFYASPSLEELWGEIFEER